ncbi:TetR/AcrR family transcriptional regulator [Spirosoma endophyticum]|uniref:Transcriptional regulator, TetR family n=1 Tax=Spirosoma endophyticum TaxID=662367 RepID=A0A1I1NXU4_9BACT|nr:TetR/AcrR family transcriptional regulator [Spirosoma endophyticum]SFD02236.1 transcriptional regulator, TetR family [Spirosoma endophyticum]
MKERILEETERLFWKYGVRSVTMEEIAKQLGISKKTIYQHFTDKEQILYEVLQDKIGKHQSEMACAVVETTNPVEEIMNVLNMMHKNADQISPNLLIDIKRYYPQAFVLFRKFKEEHIMRSILENIKKGVDQGLYRADINPDILARLRVEQIELAFDNDIFPTDQYTMHDIQYELMHHFIRGMLTDKGFTIYNQYVHLKNEFNLPLYEKK